MDVLNPEKATKEMKHKMFIIRMGTVVTDRMK
jgi:hypothetical protein